MFDTFIHELLLQTNPNVKRVLSIRLEMARLLYNAVLKEALKRVSLIKQSKLWQEAKNATSNRSKLFNQAKVNIKFSDFSLQNFAICLKNQCAIGKHLDTHTCQKIATRAFLAADQYIKNKRGKPRFKRKGWLSSVEGKNNQAGIRFRRNTICWNGLVIPVILDKKDLYQVQKHALSSWIKYCRLVRKKIKKKEVYFVQLVLEGKPLIKKRNVSKKGIVGLDIGPSSLAFFSKEKAFLGGFCEELNPLFQDRRLIQRRMDRSRRAMNPDNYEKDGRVKKGRLLWKKSKHYQKNQNGLYEKQRKLSEYRKRLHGKMANQVIRLGSHIKTEKLSYKAWQRIFGKSIGKRAPSKFLNILSRKVENTGGIFEEFATNTTCLSQICHQCETKKKKKLSQRWHTCCGLSVQRDLYSSYLAYHIKDNKLDISQAKREWPSAYPLLEQAMSSLNETAIGKSRLASFGLFQSQSGLLVKDRSEINKAEDVVGNFPRASESLCPCC